MSDKLQFVVCCEARLHRSLDKLKFIGHLLDSLKSFSRESNTISGAHGFEQLKKLCPSFR